MKPNPPDPQHFERLFRMLLDGIPSSVIVIDPDLSVADVNRNFLEKSRRLKSDVVNQHIRLVFPPELTAQLDLVAQIRKVFSRKKAQTGHRISYRAPGIPQRIYYYSLLPFTWQEEVRHVILLMVDITEQVELSNRIEEKEKYLANVMDSTTDLIVSTNFQLEIVAWNRAIEEVTGKAFPEVKGSSFLNLFGPDQSQNIEQKLVLLRNEKVDACLMESKLVSNAGVSREIAWKCSLLQDPNLDCPGFVFIGRDLTEANQLKHQLQQANKLASLGMMAGAIAHQIRNPLGICSSAAQFLNEPDLEPEFRDECIQKIYSSSQKVSSIIETMLKLAPHQEHFEKKVFNIISLLRETLKETFECHAINHIKRVDNLPHLPAYVNGNAQLIKQTFINLIHNSMEAMPQGGIISIAAEKHQREIVISIKDTGHGISDQQMDQVFDPFFSNSEDGTGMGLGLSICHSIIAMHGGGIRLTSKVNEETTAWITLPIV
ncbi:MAG: PAS domain S-box protein [Proteobacteria bacterium]|nr:PAS domain S-box protein [Pseudomonadota bacterium]